MSDEDIKKIGDEMVRVVEPIYEELGSINEELGSIKKELGGIDKELGRINKVLDEHSDKIDALTVEVHELKQGFGGSRDKTDLEIERIKEHIGLDSANIA